MTVGDGVGTGKVFHYINGKYDLHQRVYRLYGFANNVDAKYFYQWFSSHFYDRVMSMTAKTSVDSVRLEMIADMMFVAPSFEEQQKIASVLGYVDDLITLHLRKHYQYQTDSCEWKSVIFYRLNAATWEQRKLSDVADIIGGGTPSTDVPEYWDGDIDWYAPAEINDQIYVDHSERKITQLGLEKSSAKILPANKTVLFTSRAGIGKTAILQHDAATNQGFQSLVLNDDTNPYFIFTMTEMIKVKAEKVASGSTFAEISGKMLGKLEFMFPTYEEQIRIGDCFKHIDDIITLHQRNNPQ